MKTRKRLYIILAGMKQRCYYPKNKEYIAKNESIAKILEETGILKSTIHREIQLLDLQKEVGLYNREKIYPISSTH